MPAGNAQPEEAAEPAAAIAGARNFDIIETMMRYTAIIVVHIRYFFFHLLMHYYCNFFHYVLLLSVFFIFIWYICFCFKIKIAYAVFILNGFLIAQIIATLLNYVMQDEREVCTDNLSPFFPLIFSELPR